MINRQFVDSLQLLLSGSVSMTSSVISIAGEYILHHDLQLLEHDRLANE